MTHWPSSRRPTKNRRLRGMSSARGLHPISRNAHKAGLPSRVLGCSRQAVSASVLTDRQQALARMYAAYNRRVGQPATSLARLAAPRASMWRWSWILLTALAAFGPAAAVPAGTMIGDYNLAEGSYANALSGSGALGSLSPVSTTGTFGFVTSGSNPGWFWSGAGSPGSGLALAGLPANDGLTFGDYSIGMQFSLGTVTGLYRRLMLFQSGQDVGPYVANGAFEFYNLSPSGGSITANATVDFLLTRNAVTKEVRAYLNGSSTPIYSFS